MSIDWDASVLAPCHGVFGQSVTYQPFSGPVRSLTGVFDNGYQAKIQLEDGSTGWTAQDPTLGIRLAEWGSSPQQGESITIVATGQVYLVTDAQPDGHGEIKLILGSTT